MKAHRHSLSWIYSFDAHTGDDGGEGGEPEEINLPEDLSAVSDDELTQLGTQASDWFSAAQTHEASRERNETLSTLADIIDRITTEQTRRTDERAQLDAEAAQLASRLGFASDGGNGDGAPGEGDGADGGNGDGDGAGDGAGDAADGEGEGDGDGNGGGAGDGSQQAAGRRVPLSVRRQRLNVPLSEVQRRAPDPSLGTRSEALIVCAPDVPSVPAGTTLSDMDLLVDAYHRRARTLGNPSGQVTVATIKREFDVTLDREASPEAIWEIMRQAADPAHLVAAGGWCAPSTIIYDFFNIASDDGIIDVPTIGVTRGGIRWPTSPSIQDVLANVWLWTENDDIAAVTGTGTKPCVRVPCPAFNEDRLDCHGICVTAGNLTESAFPELIANHLRLTMSAHRHVMNQRFISDIVALSGAVTITGTGNPYSTGVLNAVGLQAADYRDKYRMNDNAVLEVVLPRWAKEAIRADYAKRMGVDDPFNVTDAQIMAWFDARNVRVQFVSDWQLTSIGSTGSAQNWPSTVQFLIYAAGTFVVGNGLDLDLGVVRDSVLNAKNDHTAAWTEECTLTAKIGHEGRVVTVNTCASGQTGAASGTCGV